VPHPRQDNTFIARLSSRAAHIGLLVQSVRFLTLVFLWMVYESFHRWFGTRRSRVKAFIATLSLVFALAALTSMWSLTDHLKHIQAVHTAAR
jgi:hypothetical protein